MLRVPHTSTPSTFRAPLILFAALYFLSFYYFPIIDHSHKQNSLLVSDAASLPTGFGESSKIPKKLWYKLGPKPLSDESQEWMRSCTEPNPEYEITLLTDTTASLYVSTHFAHRPDIISTYNSLPIPILRADLIRYLLLYHSGGIWNDLEVSCHLPIEEWIPEEFLGKADLVVGYEFDYGIGDVSVF